MFFEYLVMGVLVFSSGYWEILRAYKILVRKEVSYNLAIQLRLKLIRAIGGDAAVKKYEKQVLEKRNWTFWGFMSLIYGILAIGWGSFFIYLAFFS
jgi:hypothetical protein